MPSSLERPESDALDIVSVESWPSILGSLDLINDGFGDRDVNRHRTYNFGSNEDGYE